MAENPRLERALRHALKCLQEVNPQQINDLRVSRSRAISRLREAQVLLKSARFEKVKGIPHMLSDDLEHYADYLQEWAADLEQAVKDGADYDYREACAELAQIIRELGERLEEYAYAIKERLG